jgi:hypothetical protein
MKIPLAIASTVLLGGVLTACGGGDGGSGGSGGSGSDYCKDIKAAAATFGDLDSGDTASLGDAFTTFHKLADEAPGDIKDDWKTLDGAITTVETALSDAGIKIEDFADLQSGKLPEGVDMSKLTGLASEFQKLSGAEFEKASKAIETHAKDVCKVDLNKAAG